MLLRLHAPFYVAALATLCAMPPTVSRPLTSRAVPAPDSSSRFVPYGTPSDGTRDDAADTDKLIWPPPPWSETYVVRNTGGQQAVTLDNGTDYRVLLPDEAMTAKLKVSGGRNVTIIGGAFDLQAGKGNVALVFYDNGNVADRTVHVEGVLFDMDNAAADAIAVAAPTAAFQIQNVRITGVHGEFGGVHGDALQNWDGARAIRVHKATVTTAYQGFFLKTETGPIGQVHLREVDFSCQASEREAPYYLWLTRNSSSCQTFPGGASLREVYATPGVYNFGSKDVFPNVRSPPSCPAVLNDAKTELSWPSLPIRGVVKLGPPPGGPFVPAHVAGIGYRSPGYLPPLGSFPRSGFFTKGSFDP